MANFMLPVPEASIPAVEICWERSEAGSPSRLGDAVVGEEHDPELPSMTGSAFTAAATELISR